MKGRAVESFVVYFNEKTPFSLSINTFEQVKVIPDPVESFVVYFDVQQNYC